MGATGQVFLLDSPRGRDAFESSVGKKRPAENLSVPTAATVLGYDWTASPNPQPDRHR